LVLTFLRDQFSHRKLMNNWSLNLWVNLVSKWWLKWN